MKRHVLLLSCLLAILAAGILYYRRHHRTGMPASASRSAAPNQLRSPGLDRNLRTIEDVNRINRLNQEQQAPSRKQSSKDDTSR